MSRRKCSKNFISTGMLKLLAWCEHCLLKKNKQGLTCYPLPLYKDNKEEKINTSETLKHFEATLKLQIEFNSTREPAKIIQMDSQSCKIY